MPIRTYAEKIKAALKAEGVQSGTLNLSFQP